MKTSKRLLALVLAFLLAFGSVPTAVYADEGASEPAVEESAPAPKQESAPAPAPKQEAPKQEAPKQEAPKQEAPKQEAPAPEAQPEAPKQEAQPEAPKPEAQPEAPAPETQEPQPETQAPEQSGGAQPEADAPTVNENTDNNSPEDGGVSQEKEAEKEPEAQPEEAEKKAQEKKAETFTVTFELVKEDGERIDRLEEEFKDGDALKVTEKLQQKLIPLAEKDYDLVWHLDARDGEKIDLDKDVVKVTEDMTVFIVAEAPEKEEKAPETEAEPEAEAEEEAEEEPEADAGMTFAPMAVVPADNKVVVFVYKLGEDVIDTQRVKEGDILRDPGTPTKANMTFLGWEGELPAEFGKEVTAEALSSYENQQEVTVTAKMQEFAYIQFVTDDGNTVYASGGEAGTDFAFENITYEPANDSQMVTGWTSNGSSYGLSDTVRLPGVGETLTMKPVLSTRYWITFDSQGGSIVEPQSYGTNDRTVAPANPTKKGYTFVGWYTSANPGRNEQAYSFGRTLSDDVTLYAKWTAESNASYTVIFWKQQVTDSYNAADADKTYDFWFSSSQTGTVGNMTQWNNNYYGNNRLSTLTRGKDSTGFHYRTVVNATIKADGSTIVNVYYDRDTATLTYSYPNNSNVTWHGLYGQTFQQADASYVWPSSYHWSYYTYNWRGEVVSSTGMTILDGFVLSSNGWDHSDNNWSMTLHGSNPQTDYWIHHYVEQYSSTGEGEFVWKADAATNSSGWSVNDKFEGYQAAFWSKTENGTREYGSSASFAGDSSELWAYHTLKSYSLTVNTAYTQNGATYQATVNSYPQTFKYTAPLSGIAQPAAPAGIPSYYTFAGWYDNPQGEGSQLDLSSLTMPAHDYAIYAVWKAPDVTVEFDLQGGVIDNAQINKKTVKAGETVDDPGEPTRDGFIFGGWLRDGAPFNFNTPITRNTTLTAKWVSVATKVKIVYEAGENGTNPPADGNSYTVEAQAHARRGPDAKDGYSFKGWVIKGDESGKVYVPGEAFTVSSEFIVLDEGTKTGTLTLVAQYVQTGDGTADLTYHSNYPANTLTNGEKVEAVEVNTRYTLKNDVFVAPAGYEFKGWTKSVLSGAASILTTSVLVDKNGANDVYAVWSPLDFTVTVEHKTDARVFETSDEKVEFPWGWNVSADANKYKENGVNVDGNHYIWESVTGQVTGQGWPLHGNVTVTVTYTLDNDKDNIPDKYQREVTYKAENGQFGAENPIGDTYTETVTFAVKDGDTWTPTDTAKLNPPVAGKHPNAGYKADDWVEVPGTTVTKDGPFEYTYKYVPAKVTLTVNYVTDTDRTQLQDPTTEQVTIGETYTVGINGETVKVPESIDNYVLDHYEGETTGEMGADGANVTAVYSLDENKDGTPDKYQVTVTFEVKNGTLTEGGTTRTEDVVLAEKQSDGTWKEKTDVKLEHVPENGKDMNPNAGYGNGSWNSVPAVPKTDTTYTYTYVEGEKITITYTATEGGSVDSKSETLAPATGKATGSTATAAAGYHFKNWTKDGVEVSTDEHFTPEKVGGLNVAATYTANFEEDADVTITYTATEGGSVNPGSETLAPATGVATGSTATAEEGYVFENWTDKDGKQVSDEAEFVPEKVDGLNVAATYTANFAKDDNGDNVPDKYQVTVTYKIENGTFGESETTRTEVVTLTDGDGKFATVAEGGVGHLKSIPDDMQAAEGYDKSEGAWQGEEPTDEANITGDKTYTYSYELNTYTVLVEYYYDEVKGEVPEGAAAKVGPVNHGAMASVIPADEVNMGRTHYALDYVEDNSVAVTSDDQTIKVYYATDEIGPSDDPNKPIPDKIPDKYQVQVLYWVIGDWGDGNTVGPDKATRKLGYLEVVTFKDEAGNYLEKSDVHAHSLAVAGEGWTFDHWDFLEGGKSHADSEAVVFVGPALDYTIEGARGGSLYNFYAYFEKDVNDDDIPDKDQEIIVNASGHNATKEYNGVPHSVNGFDYTVTIGEHTYTADQAREFGVTVTCGNDIAGGRDAGNYPMGLKEADFTIQQGGSFGSAKMGDIEDGWLEITKRPVTLTSATDDKEYDGKALTNNEITVGGDGFVEGEGATYDVTGSQTLVGSSANSFTYTLNENTKADNYDITKTEGTLTVKDRTTPYEITVKAKSATEEYDGNDHSVSGFESLTFTLDNGETYTVSGLEASASGTDAKEYDSKVTGTAVVKDADGNDVTEQFTVKTVDGKLTIDPATLDVYITGDTVTANYDGQEHTASGFDIRLAGLKKEDDEITVTVVEGKKDKATVTRKDVGKTEMELFVSDFVVGGEAAGNYTINKHYTNGWVQVTAIPLTITINGNNETYVYNGTEQKANGFTFTTAGLLEGEDIEVVLKAGHMAEATQKDVGKKSMGLKGLDFNVIGAGNYNYKVSVGQDGWVEITKRPVTLTSATDDKVYDGKALTNDEITVGGDGFVEGEGATYNVTGSQTLVGSSANSFTYTLNENTNPKNYNITKTEGTLTVNDRTEKFEITVKANSKTETYDGTEKKVEGFESLEFNFDGVNFTVEGLSASAKGIPAGTYDAKVTGTAVVKDADGNDVTGQFTVNTEDGKLTIVAQSINPDDPEVPDPENPDKPVYGGVVIDGPSDHVYDGNEHKWAPNVTDKDGKVLTEGVDYTVKYSTDDFTNVTGEITVTITGTGNYAGTVTRTYEITPKGYTVTTDSASKPHDGEPLTAPGEIEGLVNETDATFTVTGSQTDVGTSDNTYTVEFVNEQMAKNYQLDKENIGTLEVLKNTIGPDEYADIHQVEIDYVSAGNGSVGPTKDIITFADDATEGDVTAHSVATPADGYKFDHWTVSEGGQLTAPAKAELDESFRSEGDKVYTYTANFVKDSFGYTVNYYYDGVQAEDETVTGSDEFESNIPYEAPGTKDHDGQNYILESVTNENGTITSNAANNVVDVYYTLDEKGPDGGPDGTADKYQVTLEYVADPAAGGSVSKTSEVVTIPGEKQTTGTVTAAATASASEGYVFDGWTSDVTIAAPDSAALSQDFQANGGETYTFTATFAADTKGGTDPENPEGGPDGTADKYQAFVVYQSAGNGTVAPSGLQTITFPEKATSGNVNVASVATAAEGYAFDYWDMNGTPFNSEAALSQSFEAQGNTTYTYTAHFAEDVNGDNIPDYRQAVTVYVAGSKDTAVYDGENHTVSGYEITGVTVGGVSAGTVLPNGVSIDTTSATVTASAVGTHYMGLTADSFTVENGTFQSVTVVVTDGWLQIYANTITPTDPTDPDPEPEPAPEPGEEPEPNPDPVYGGVTVGELEDVVYNGQSQAQTPTVTDKDGNPLPEGSYTVSWSEDTTNAGQVTVTVTGQNGYTGEVTRTYDITPAPYTVTTESASKVYDGDELTAPGEIEGLVNEADATLNVTGRRTDVGTSRNTYTVEFSSEQMAKNYELESANVGTLTVTAQSIDPTDPTEPDPENPEQPVYGGVVIDDPSNSVYDGTAHQWAPTVTDEDGNVLTEGVDYTVSYDTNDFTDAGTITVTIEGMGNYSGEVTKSYEITKRTVTLTSGTESWTYDGEAHRNETVTEGGEGFVAGEGASYSNFASITNEGSIPNTFEYALNENTKAENYTITPSYGTLTVGTKSIEPDPEDPDDPNAVQINDPSNSVYDGTAHQWAPTVTDEDGNVLTEGVDYTVEYSTDDFTDAGTITVTIEGMGNYSGEVTKTYNITPAALTVNTASATRMYNGAALTAGGTIRGLVNNEIATVNTTSTITNQGVADNDDYTITWGTAKRSNYTVRRGTMGTLTVTPRTVVMTSGSGTKLYDGAALTNGTVTVSGDGFINGEGATYNVTGTRTDVGSSQNTFTYTLNAGTLARNYNITRNYGTLTVNNVSILGMTVGTPTNFVYDGAAHQWAPTVSGNNGPLTAGTDYTVTYSTNDFTDVGTIRVTITGTGNYSGSVTRTYRITPRAVVMTSPSATKTYDGTALRATNVTATGFVAGEGASYNVTGTRTTVGSSRNGFTYTLNAGTDADNYTITQNYGTLTVNGLSIAGLAVGTPTNSVYDGATHQWTPTVTGDNGALRAGTDYTVTYSTGNFVDVGTIRVTITGRGNYTGTVTRTYRITPRAVTMTSASATKEYDARVLRDDDVTATGFVAGEGATYNVTGRRTTPGTSQNTFTYTLNANTDEDNYNIRQVYGNLTVTPVEAPEPTDAPEPTEIPEDDTPLGGLPEGMEPGYDLNEEVVITDDETPLAGGPTEQICCILHFILMLGALCVAMYYTHDRKKRQEREFELRSELQE